MVLRGGPSNLRSGSNRRKFSGVSLPLAILLEIDLLIKELGFWPSRSAFVREACLEKIRRERQELKERREVEPEANHGD